MDLAHARARALVTDGRFEEADPWFLNALARSPADLTVLKDFVDAVLVAAQRRRERGAGAEALAQLEWLESFLQERIAHVSAEDVETVLLLAARAASHRSELGAEGAARFAGPRVSDLLDGLPLEVRDFGDPAGSPDPRLRARLEEVGLHDVPEAAEARAGWLRSLADRARREGDASAARRFEEAAAAHELAARFDETAAEAEGLLARCVVEPDVRVAAYLAQAADGLVRDLILHETSMSPKRRTRAREVLESLERASEAVAEKQTLANAADVLKKFHLVHDAALREARGWPAPAIAAGSPAARCQGQLERVGRLRVAVERLLLAVERTSVHEAATKLAGELEKLGNAAVETQRRLYNAWALEQIRNAFAEGRKHMGVLDDEAKIGSAIVTFLGPIDVRHLDMEVGRAWSEVFEILYGRLDKVDSEADFRVTTTKLYTLAKLAEQARRTPSEW